MPILDMDYEVRPTRPFRWVTPHDDPTIAARNEDRNMRDAVNQTWDAIYRVFEVGQVANNKFNDLSEAFAAMLSAVQLLQTAMENVHAAHGLH